MEVVGVLDGAGVGVDEGAFDGAWVIFVGVPVDRVGELVGVVVDAVGEKVGAFEGAAEGDALVGVVVIFVGDEEGFLEEVVGEELGFNVSSKGTVVAVGAVVGVVVAVGVAVGVVVGVVVVHNSTSLRGGGGVLVEPYGFAGATFTWY